MNAEATERILWHDATFQALPTLREHDMPRVSNILQNYRVPFVHLAKRFFENGSRKRAKAVLQRMDQVIPEAVLPVAEAYKGVIERLKTAIGYE